MSSIETFDVVVVGVVLQVLLQRTPWPNEGTRSCY